MADYTDINYLSTLKVSPVFISSFHSERLDWVSWWLWFATVAAPGDSIKQFGKSKTSHSLGKAENVYMLEKCLKGLHVWERLKMFTC